MQAIKIENLEDRSEFSMAENLTSTPVVAVSSQISSQPANVAGAVNEALDIERRQMNLVMSRIPESDLLFVGEQLQVLQEDLVLDITGLVLHYENTPIQIYGKFLLQELKIFR